MSARAARATEFFKLSGAGNDFVALAEPDREPPPEQIAGWCRRGLSLGADGLFVLRRLPGAGTVPRVAMTHYNADGGRAELCFNGARCAARLAFHLGWADNVVEVATEAGAFRAEPGPSRGTIAIEALVPAEAPRPVRLEVSGAGLDAWRLVVGVPHLVVLSETPIGELDLPRLAPPLRSHATLGPAGANVDFVSFPEPGVLELRTWERGVEGETLACGSGILASARVGLMLEAATLPLDVRTRGGRALRLEGVAKDGEPVRWRLIGDARLVAEGSLTRESY